MHKIIKSRWILFAIWIAALVLSLIYSPDLSKILRQKGTQYLSSNNISVKAQNMLDEMDKTPGNSDLIVFHSDSKLTSSDLKNIEKGVKSLKKDKSSLGINNIMDPFSMPDIKSKLISSDKKTLMVTFKLNKKGREVTDIKSSFKNVLKNVHSDYYLTGSDFISDDYLRAISAGVDKSAILTVLFILIVLIIMFRSIVTPLISLLGVAISYLVSVAIVGQCIYRFDFAISALTQIVLVLILFGIGTDYNILLFNRFKEELGNHDSIDDAIVATYKTAGKTIVFSISTVFVAFLSLSLAKFEPYRSANCVAIAVVVLLLEIFTFTPFLMKILGPKLFWPSKKVTEHKQSAFWAKTSAYAVKKPIVPALVILGVIIITSFFGIKTYSYDNLKELGSSYDSVKGFNIVSDGFGEGQALTTTVVIKNNKAMDNKDSLAAIDEITNSLKSVKGVKSVSSATQPLSDPINSLYISNQTKTVVNGLWQAKSGVDQINNGVDQISTKLKSTDMSGLSKVNLLVDGTGQVENGMNLVNTGMQEVNAGIAQGANGASQIADGAAKAQTGLKTIMNYTSQLSNGLDQLNDGYNKLGSAYNGISVGSSQLKDGLSKLNASVGQLNQVLKGNGRSNLTDGINKLVSASNNLNTIANDKQKGLDVIIKSDPYLQMAMKNDPNFVNAIGGIQQYSAGLSNSMGQLQPQLQAQVNTLNDATSQLSGGANDLNSGVVAFKKNYDLLTSKLGEASSALKQINAAQSQLNDGLTQLQSGSSALAVGLNKAHDGQSQLVDNMPKLTSGIDQVRKGQITLNDSLTKFASNMPALKDALNKSGNGLTQVSDGLSQTNAYLKQLNDSSTFFMPDEALNNSSMKQSINSYMSKNRKITKLTVVLNSDPYSSDAMNTAKDVDNEAKSGIKNTSLKNAEVETAGVSSSDYDLNKTAKSDMSTMSVIVLVSVFLILFFIIRSPLISLYITGSLAGAYYISSCVLNFIVMNIFKYDGISYNVPFFSFVMIVALGVDYSIFLMMRFKEFGDLDKKQAIVEASKNIGGIVMSAALILGGTFITMVPAGIRLLTELAIAVVIGLAALALLLLPIFLPALIALPEAVKNIFSKKNNNKNEKENEHIA
ncbi:MAG: MMPL family transporter [Clostridium sp.]|nr:MMPL family transporter [Clostridium sp.]